MPNTITSVHVDIPWIVHISTLQYWEMNRCIFIYIFTAQTRHLGERRQVLVCGFVKTNPGRRIPLGYVTGHAIGRFGRLIRWVLSHQQTCDDIDICVFSFLKHLKSMLCQRIVAADPPFVKMWRAAGRRSLRTYADSVAQRLRSLIWELHWPMIRK